MNMNMNTRVLVISALALLVFDFIYLSVIKKYFNSQVKAIQGSEIQMDYFAGFLCYVLMIIGINYFILQNRKPVLDAFILGILVYFVFDLTNKAIFREYTWKTVIMDGLWGGILFASVTYITYMMTPEMTSF